MSPRKARRNKRQGWEDAQKKDRKKFKGTVKPEENTWGADILKQMRADGLVAPNPWEAKLILTKCQEATNKNPLGDKRATELAHRLGIFCEASERAPE